MRWGPIVSLLAACGAGSSTSKDDSNAMAGQLVAVAASALAGAQQAPPGAVSADRSVACAAGGTAGIAGDLTGDLDATATGSYSVDVMTTFGDCALGNGLVINGAPYLSTTGSLSFRNGQPAAASLVFTGALTAGNDTCNVDVTVRLVPTPSATGTICGNPVRLAQ